MHAYRVWTFTFQ